MNLQQQLQTALSQKQKNFSGIFIAFIKSTLNLEHFDKKSESHSFSISQIIDSEGGGYLNVQNAFFRTPFGNQRVHEFQTLSKSARHHLYLIFPWIWDKLSWKKCRLVRFEILELFVNTWLPMTSIPVAISRFDPTTSNDYVSKTKTFYRIFITYVKSRTSSDDFVKKDESTSLSFYDIIDAEKSGYLNVYRPCFRTSFANQGLHEFQTPRKSTPSHYYLIFPLIWDK